MLSKQTYTYFMIMATFNFFILGGPIRWDFKKNQFKIIKSEAFKKFTNFLNFVILVPYYIYLIWRVAEVFQIHDKYDSKDDTGDDEEGASFDNGELFKRIFQCIGYGLSLSFHINKYYHYFDIPVFMNAYIQLSEDMERKYFPYLKEEAVFKNATNFNDGNNSKNSARTSRKNGSEKMLRIFLIMTILICTIVVLETITAPGLPQFLSSLLENPMGLSFLERLPFVILHNFIHCSFWAMNLYHAYPVYSYMFSRTNILRRLILDTRQVAFNERDKENFLHIYRCLQIEHRLFNNSFRYIYFPGHNLLQGSAAICCFYGLIKMSGSSVAHFAVLSCVYVGHFTVFFGTLSLFFELSEKAISSWKMRAGDAYWRKSFQSCRSLKIYIGSFYYVDKLEVLSFWNVIVNNTITLLLSF